MERSRTTAIKAIRQKCLDCSGESMAEVRMCDIENCPLHPFRMGKNPNIGRREMSDAQRAAVNERLAKARAVKAQGKANG